MYVQPGMQWNRICSVEKNVVVGDRGVSRGKRRERRGERGELGYGNTTGVKGIRVGAPTQIKDR